jgi:hypothetical protein
VCATCQVRCCVSCTFEHWLNGAICMGCVKLSSWTPRRSAPQIYSPTGQRGAS